MKKIFFWMGLFLVVNHASCASATSLHEEKPEHDKTAQVAPHGDAKQNEKASHDKAPAATHKGPHWGYAGKTGADHWGSLDPAYKSCASGKEQSPIDITNLKTKDIENIRFHYRPSKLNILNNGHTIQVDIDKGSSIRIDGEKYDLLQFHFHTPSEHAIEGIRYPMEIHLVHKSKKGELAVVGVMMVVDKHNSVLESLFDNFPGEEGKENLMDKIDVGALLPAGERTFRYPGSLTTPPCTEGVKWNLLLAPISISNEQFTSFHDIFENNSRPVQPIRKRVIWEDTTP